MQKPVELEDKSTSAEMEEGKDEVLFSFISCTIDLSLCFFHNLSVQDYYDLPMPFQSKVLLYANAIYLQDTPKDDVCKENDRLIVNVEKVACNS